MDFSSIDSLASLVDARGHSIQHGMFDVPQPEIATCTRAFTNVSPAANVPGVVVRSSVSPPTAGATLRARLPVTGWSVALRTLMAASIDAALPVGYDIQRFDAHGRQRPAVPRSR